MPPHYAKLITLEMGKLLKEARGEVEKCALGCDYYADHAERFLQDEVIASDAGKSYVAYLPLGTLLAVMPWNFPFWQVVPRRRAGAHGRQHRRAQARLERAAVRARDRRGVSRKQGSRRACSRTLMITAEQAEKLIADKRIHAVTLTGSEAAGRKIAAAAGAALKKTVLELGGSDAFVVLADADLDDAAAIGVAARYLNAGQSCIAAKRFILVESIADAYIEKFKQKALALKPGDPMQDGTTFAPLARPDLRDQLHRQVTDSIKAGAKAAFGCEPLTGPGNFYKPSMLDRVGPGMRAYEEELFGPVAIVIRAKDEARRAAHRQRQPLRPRRQRLDEGFTERAMNSPDACSRARASSTAW